MKRVREKVSNPFQGEDYTKRVSNSLKFIFLNALERIEKESIVTKRVAHGEVIKLFPSFDGGLFSKHAFG
ncbi:MAG TPA: hypothetical protein DCF63_16390 [Planctomycetaceae bacterium]|nr:hypothetical protein [Planctomycetaceae bacterium]